MPNPLHGSTALLVALACPAIACGDSTASLETGSASATTTGSGDDASSDQEATGSTSTGPGSGSGSDDPSTSDASGHVSTGISDDGESTDGESTDGESTDDGDDTETTGGIDLSCVDLDVGSALGDSLAVGSVAGHGDNVTNPCSFESEDYVVQFTAPYGGVFTFSLEGSDGCEMGCAWGPQDGTTMVIVDEHCAGPVLACNEALFAGKATASDTLFSAPFSWERRVLAEGQTVLVAIGGPAQFDLSITGVPLGTDESCVDIDLGQAIGPGVAQGDLATSEDDLALVGPPYTGVCPATSIPEDVLRFTAPATGTYLFTAVGTQQSNKGMMLLPAGCEVSSEHVFACASGTYVHGQDEIGTRLTADLVAEQPLLVVIEGAADEYTLDIAANATPGGTCCGPRKSGGCSVPSIEACVCDVDDWCCFVNWDFFCANRARFMCDASCIE